MVPAPLKTDMSLQGKRKEQKKAGPMPGLVSSIKTKREQKRLWLRVGATLERGAVVVLGAVSTCQPRPCPKGSYWNQKNCRCEAGAPQ